MSLEDYEKKRDFSKTPEPPSEVNQDAKSRFVIQRHQASRLHYDLRLEIEGVLASWAVPKGPSMNSKDKRLAIRTEDHPVKYLHFKGSIPKGNYGAGEMSIWDSGVYKSAIDSKSIIEQLNEGNLKLIFKGEKIKGEFALVKTNSEKGDQWLLIKKGDSYSTDLNYDAEDYIPRSTSKKAKFRELKNRKTIAPMLATSTAEIFNDPKWIYELKWDGYRIISHIKDTKVHIQSRNGITYNSKFPALVKDLENIPHDAVLDGELVLLDKNGKSVFQELQNYDGSTKLHLKYYVFDMLFLNGHSMIDLPLLERKSLIPEVLEDTAVAVYCDHIEGMGTAFYNKAVEAGMEGVIAKKADSVYRPGIRSEDWLKIKKEESQEAIICGYTTSEKTAFGSLILGIEEDNTLKYIGNCGTGFGRGGKKALLQKMKKLQVKTSPFEEKIDLKGREPKWIEPKLVCEVIFSEWTKEGKMRHPVFKAVRKDKEPEEARLQPSVDKAAEASAGAEDRLEINGRQVSVTNLSKVYWPDSGLRKFDLIDYYLKISEIILPYLKDRPQNLHRHPNGINKKGFYQKDTKGFNENWLETTRVYSESSQKDIEYLLCQDEASLIYMANLGCIELNPWNSRIGNLEKPDYAVIDLDPSSKNNFEEVIEVAQVTYELLKAAEIGAYCKTSGSTGIHIYIPMGGEYTYNEVRDFTKIICYLIQDALPDLTSMERVVKNRKGKIYLDYLQNRKGQTLAAPYCVRPKKGAPVSAPIEWKELKSGLRITDFNMNNMPQRLEKKGDLFHAVLTSEFEMYDAIDRLNSL
ncbi:DNA ligase D [Christiangramia salexigens]|uniref:DNA ligase (ATP) n=1 Tax=Christiangramia salexigens TaxID=1913577 RepID=A0A1L3J570_9FLAO|nr:DNA ligase D [Christiangramia salexigens]APG60299.1 DNA ligase D [Christiangramia salexigens]